MQRSIYLARLIGPVLVVIGLGSLINAAIYRAMAGEMLNSIAFIYIAGVFALIAGLALVLAHNVWVAGWPLIITVLGWLGIVGGAFRILAPQQVAALGANIISHPLLPMISGGLVLLFGAVLSYFGYEECFAGHNPRGSRTTRKRKR
jgi:hypothetical protein